MRIVDTIQDLFDRLVDNLGILGGHRTLQDTRSSNILINNSFEILRLPEGVLLEEVLKILIEDGDKRNGFLAKAHAKDQEMLDILCVDKLLAGFGIRLEEFFDEGIRMFEFGVTLNHGGFAFRISKSLLNTAHEVAGQASQTLVNPALLMLDVHQISHATNDFSICHVLQIDGLACGVPAEPNLLEIIIELLNDVLALLFELRHSLCFVETEDFLIHLGPEANTTSCKFVNRLAHFGSHCNDTTSGTFVGLLPIAVVKTFSFRNCLLCILRSVCLLGGHHATPE